MKSSKEGQQALLHCFLLAANAKGQSLSLEQVQAEWLAQGQAVTPELLVTMALRFDCKVEHRVVVFKSLLTLPTPIILLLKDSQACVLLDIDKPKKEAVIQSWEQGKATTRRVTFSMLSDRYLGDCLSLSTNDAFESRVNDAEIKSASSSWFWSVLWQFRSTYKHVLLAALVINVFALVMPLFTMNVYDRVVPNNAIETLWVLVSGVIIVLMFDLLLKTLRAYFVDIANKRMDVVLSASLLSKSLGIEMSRQPLSAGVRVDHLKDFESVRDFFSSVVLVSVIDIPFLMIFIGVISYIGGPLGWIPIIIASLIITSSVLLSIPLNRYIRQTFSGSAQKAAILFESLSSIELIKSTCAFGEVLERWTRYTVKVANDALKSRFYSVLAVNLASFFITMATVSTVVSGVYLIRAGELTLGGLIACVILMGRTLNPLAQVAGLLTRAQQTRCSLEALNNIMREKEERPLGKRFIHPKNIKGEVVFDKVSFAYPNQFVKVLDNVSFSIRPGERIALLGPMGTGKSTVLKLIMGLYQPMSGTVCIDGLDNRQIDPIILRRQIGYLEQSPRLLFGTARFNVSLRQPDADEAAVLQALKRAGADVFLSRHPEGINQMIAEQGKGLSGGQIQTLALARTLLLDPALLLLDEPTSMLDAAAEQRFLQTISTDFKGKTLLMTTHKKRLLDFVDRAIVFQKGRVVADGPIRDILSQLTKPRKMPSGAAHERA